MRRSRSRVAACALVAACGHADPPLGGDGAPGPGVDAPPSHDGKVPIFIAQGTLGRTIISCDDGRTWVANHSWDVDGDALMCGMVQDGVRCGQSTCSYVVGDQCVPLTCCDDTPDIPEGVAFGPDAIVGAWGHGKPGALRTTTDGAIWTTTETSYAYSVAYGSGRFVAAGNRRTEWSTDGRVWMPGGDAAFNTNGSPVRSFGYGDFGAGGRFVAVSAGGGLRDILVSSDGGLTWKRPSVVPDSCALGVGTNGGDILGGPDGLLLIVDGHGTACWSRDGGDTWSVSPTGLTQIASHGMWTGTEFRYWGENQMVASSDGMSWHATPLATPTRIGPTARSDAGTFVAVPYVFDSYERQHMLRSTDDGITWEPLAIEAFPQGHAIYRIGFGYANPSEVCP